MTVAERMKLVQVIEKFNANKGFTRRLGVRDVSVFKKDSQRKIDQKS